MASIRDLLARDLSEGIEEVVKVDQRQERIVRDELLEYVFTESIREDYAMLLGAIADSPSEPREDVGVWISGFFGSGKSSFAKNLGYILANNSVLGRSATELFLQQLQQQAPHDRLTREIRNRLEFVNARLTTHVAMFDVQKDRDVQGDSTLAQIMYTVLLRGLDYSTDEALAELEIGLEGEGRLGTFVQLCAEL
ncbi:MAG: BREX system P-loop protein BrxC, partial [Chloroflexi bacterium]|nr:BREX system P-loop protein BrxC [Chloroflexota bacterium]